jgi:hypothetical protein
MTSRDDLRIGDAEREEMMAALREHFAQGRITHDELDERLDLTLHARTGRELAKVAEDLPDLRPAVQPAPPHPRRARHHHHHWHGAHTDWNGRRRRGLPAPAFLFLLAVIMMAGGPQLLLAMILIGLAFAMVRSAHHHLNQTHTRL